MADKSKPPALRRETSAASRCVSIRSANSMDSAGSRRNTFAVSSVHFSHGRFSFRAHLSSPATRTIDIFVSPCLASEFSLFHATMATAGGYFSAEYFWPCVNLWNLCRCVSFGLLLVERSGPLIVARLFTERSVGSFVTREIFNVRFSDG